MKMSSDVKIGWGHRTYKCAQMFILDVRGGTPHIQLMDIWPDVLNGVGTPHIILRKSLAVGWGGWVGVVGGWSEADNNATPWLHLASWNLPDSKPS